MTDYFFQSHVAEYFHNQAMPFMPSTCANAAVPGKTVNLGIT